MTRLHTVESLCSAPTCRAPIWWLTNPKTQKKAPIDPAPDDAGNCLVDLATETYQVIRADARADYAGLQKLHTNHFQTCPARAQFGEKASTTLPAPKPPTLVIRPIPGWPQVELWYGGVHLGQFDDRAKAEQFKAVFKVQVIREIVAEFDTVGMTGETLGGRVLARLLAEVEKEIHP